MVLNSAFVFLKPHADTEAVRSLLTETLKKHNITVVLEGSLDSADLSARQVVDLHYWSLARSATLTKAADLLPPSVGNFSKKFVSKSPRPA